MTSHSPFNCTYCSPLPARSLCVPCPYQPWHPPPRPPPISALPYFRLMPDRVQEHEVPLRRPPVAIGQARWAGGLCSRCWFRDRFHCQLCCFTWSYHLWEAGITSCLRVSFAPWVQVEYYYCYTEYLSVLRKSRWAVFPLKMASPGELFEKPEMNWCQLSVLSLAGV